MSITVIKPVSAGQVRVTLDVTYGQIATASAFDANALSVFAGKGAERAKVFHLSVSKNGYIGAKGIELPEGKASEKVTVLIKMDGAGTDAFYATLARASQHLGVIEKQILETVDAFDKAKATVVEV